MSLTAGSKLGSCEVVSLLGVGGMGEVYRARDPRLGREVAIKVLPASFAADAERMSRFEQEARAAGALNHPNLMTVHELGRHDEQVYIVSELLEGETLRERLSAGAIGVKRAVDYALQVANGLAAAHEKGIVHRDLKPENIFITTDDRVKILDFGLAKLRGDVEAGTEAPTARVHTDPGTVMGTVGYMSPEQVRGHNVDPRSDIFSFGAVLYEMLSGRRAFHGDSRADTMSAVLREDPPDLSQSGRAIPVGLDRIVQHCLEKNPARRFQSARDVAFNLESLSTTSTSQPQAAVHEVRMRPFAIGAGVLLLLALGALGGALAYRRWRDSTVISYKPLTFRRGAVQWARFLADGQSFVYSATWEGEANKAYMATIGSPVSRDLALPGSVSAVSPEGELAIILPGNVLARVPLTGAAPRELVANAISADWLPGGKELAVMRFVSGYYQIEFPLGRPVTRATYTNGGFRVSPDGKWVAFSDCDAATGPCDVVLVDRNGTTRTLGGGFGAKMRIGLAWHPRGKEVWFTGAKGAASRDVYASTVEGSMRVVTRFPSNVFLQDVNRNGDVLIEVLTYRGETVMESAKDKTSRSLSWLDATTAEDLSADGKTLLFSETGEAEGNVDAASYIRELDGSPPVRLTEGVALRLSPDGSRAVVYQAGKPPRIVIVPVKAGAPTPLQNPNFIDYQGIEWMPDGKRLIFTATTANGKRAVYLQDIAAGTVSRVTPEGAGFGSPCKCISPDGEWIIATKPFEAERLLYPVKGGAPRPLPGLSGGLRPIQWLPDGKTLLVTPRGLPPLSIERYDVATGRRTPWVKVGPSDSSGIRDLARFRASADLTTYVYSYDRLQSQLLLVQGLE